MKITKVETVYDGFYKMRKLTLEHEGEQLTRERFEPGHAVAALVFDTNKHQYAFVRQFRVGAEKELLEIAAGMLDKDGEAPEEAMRREIEEELGYAVDQLEHIVDIYPSPGADAETIKIYYAEVSQRVGLGGGLEEEHENIRVVYLNEEQLRRESLQDAKTLIAVQWAQLRQQK